MGRDKVQTWAYVNELYIDYTFICIIKVNQQHLYIKKMHCNITFINNYIAKSNKYISMIVTVMYLILV